MGQSCCGLPLLMLGEKKAGRELAAHNMIRESAHEGKRLGVPPPK